MEMCVGMPLTDKHCDAEEITDREIQRILLKILALTELNELGPSHCFECQCPDPEKS